MAITRRREAPVSYKTTVKNSAVEALRDVFDSNYKEREFQGLHIFPEFPFEDIKYPAIYIKYNEGPVRNMGVGHSEYFPDSTGALRKWKHFQFEGTLEFDIITLSTLDRDILSDALVELMTMGTLEPALDKFFGHFYGNPTDPYSVVSLFHQLNLNTDELSPLGDSAGLAPWGAEDTLVFQTGYQMDVTGGFYNSIPNPTGVPLEYINVVTIDPRITDDPYSVDNDGIWTYPFVYYDNNIVQGQGHVSGTESTKFDSATVTGVAVISGQTGSANIDAAIVSGHALPTSVEIIVYSDSGVARGVAAHRTFIEFASYVDPNALSQGTAVPSASQLGAFLDASTVRATAAPSSTEVTTFTEVSAVATGHMAVDGDGALLAGTDLLPDTTLLLSDPYKSAIDIFSGLDSNRVTASALPYTSQETFDFANIYFDITGIVTGHAAHSGSEDSANIDQATVTSVSAISSVQIFTPVSEVRTATGVAVISSSDVYAALGELSVSQGVAVPSGADLAAYLDASAVTSIAAHSSINGGVYLDANTVQATGIPIGNEGSGYVESSSVTGVAAFVTVNTHGVLDSATVTAIAVPSDAESYNTLDAATEVSVGTPSGADLGAFLDAATLTSVATISYVSNRLFFDADTVTSITDLSGTIEARGFADFPTITSIAVPSGANILSAIDASTSIGVAVPSATDGYGVIQIDAVTSVAVPSAAIGSGYTDTGTASAIAVPSGGDVHGYTDAGTVTSTGAQEPPITTNFHDAMGRTASSGWGNSWVVDNGTAADFNATSGAATIAVPTAGGNAHIIRQPGTLTDTETSVLFSVNTASVTGGAYEVLSIFSRTNSASPTINFYRAICHLTTANVFEINIQKVVANVTSTITAYASSPLTLVSGKQYRMVMRTTDANPTSIYAKVEDPLSPLGAGVWTVTGLDPTSSFTSGDTSIRAFRQSGNTNTGIVTTVNDVLVTSIPGAGLDIYTP